MASPFVDKVTITVRAGDGGNGAVTFHREKYVAAGGPDGGDGGRGGDIIFEVDDNMSTLMDFRYKRKYVAANGADGQGKRCSGRVGQSLHIRVPRGTLLRDADSGAIMHDMSSGEPFVAARGGRGGWGNQHFATPTRQVPRFAKPGLPGESHTILLELKLLADVGLVGFPNVGKSTLLSVVSKAHPKIANYHFTTLFPNLGVVYVSEGSSFVMADIPGIIEGASDGAGLGHDFLRHIDRCRLLVHLVDVSGSEGRDPVEDFEAINAELRAYSDVLASRMQIVAANKCDLLGDDRTNIDRLRAHVEAPPPTPARASSSRRARPNSPRSLRCRRTRPTMFRPNRKSARATSCRSATLTISGSSRGRGCSGSWARSTLVTTSRACTLTACCASPACLTGSRPWASRKATR